MKKQNFQTPISPAESQAACKAILASDKFVHAPRMCRLLHFLVESAICGNSRNTSEYAIGIEVFDRNVATYSTTEDPAVRVQVGRLREKLKDYYAAVPSEIEISIPLGSYMPIFKRSSDANIYPGHTLLFRPIRAISECSKGQCFALGLHEELLHQLFLAFNSITLIQHSEDDFKVRHSNESKKTFNAAAKHLFEGFVRIDSQRVRTSVHLLDLEHNQIRWSKQFDRNNCYDISLQEELAFSICQELKLFMLENELNYFDSESPQSEQPQQENRITHIGQGRRLTSQ
ncbi:MAG: hypothetical protein KJ556_04115 [Gammaproteobacteria bacterium]|nr:hypothetical protein [Gammaproteobacteria bacterium]MBU2057940.1 hypothetical protein [Gammaproteobacteria bacterium]MBU2174292.1 hypothetical protein [Gammaproteobacteria bacterium]MBU2247758.1 hypothetical protein [Gammaproteobacteria bacterium]MBU2344283.1 hypothetical protein [Gammaproteobacteria bacterium]